MHCEPLSWNWNHSLQITFKLSHYPQFNFLAISIAMLLRWKLEGNIIIQFPCLCSHAQNIRRKEGLSCFRSFTIFLRKWYAVHTTDGLREVPLFSLKNLTLSWCSVSTVSVMSSVIFSLLFCGTVSDNEMLKLWRILWVPV